MCSMYENIDDGAFIGRKQFFVLMFKVNFLELGLLSFFFLSFLYIYTYNLKHNASLTHVTSFRLMTPKPVGLRALGVETPFELNNSGYRYWYVNSAMFNSLKLFSLTHVTCVGPIAPKLVDFRVLGVKIPLRA